MEPPTAPTTRPHAPESLHGPQGIRTLGHRTYVGGMWDEIGMHQFKFLVSRGLRPWHYFMDIACGCLRGGVHLIPYLETAHYLGVDKEAELLRAGVEEELGMDLYRIKRPELLVSEAFEFEKFSVRPDYALAQSLFTHLPPPIIRLCLSKLRPWMKDGGSFFATYFETDVRADNPDRPHDHENFRYTQREMEEFGAATGWRTEYIGDWGHPRGQVMVCYRAE